MVGAWLGAKTRRRPGGAASGGEYGVPVGRREREPERGQPDDLECAALRCFSRDGAADAHPGVCSGGRRGQFHIFTSSKNYESSWKSFETSVAGVSVPGSPSRGTGGVRQTAGLSDQRCRKCSTLRTRFHSTYIKHKPELTNAHFGTPRRGGKAHSQILHKVTKNNRDKQTSGEMVCNV